MQGTVKGYEIKENKDGENKVCMLQVEISTPEDVQSVELLRTGGNDYIPPNGSTVQIFQNGEGWKVATSVDDQTDFDSRVKQGERLIYSIKDGVKKAEAIFREDGSIEINGSDDNAVSYADLKTAIDNAVTSINDAITSAITGHTHPGVMSGPSSTGNGAGSGSSVSIDISASKVESVKLP